MLGFGFAGHCVGTYMQINRKASVFSVAMFPTGLENLMKLGGR